MAMARGNADPISAKWARQTLTTYPALRMQLDQILTTFSSTYGLKIPASASKNQVKRLEHKMDAILHQVASPHFKAFYEGRHQYSHAMIEAALKQGHAVVVDEFGAGLDPVVHNFVKKRPNKAIFINEHDEWATQEYKQSLLGKKLPKNVRLHGLNFEHADDQRNKMQAGFEASQAYFKGKPTQHLLFMKGLLYYLEPQAVTGLFQDALDTYPVGSQIFADCYTQQNWQGTDPLTFRYRHLLEALGEHVKLTTDDLSQDLAHLVSQDGTKKLVLEQKEPRGQAAARFIKDDPAKQTAVAQDAFGNASIFYTFKIVPNTP